MFFEVEWNSVLLQATFNDKNNDDDQEITTDNLGLQCLNINYLVYCI